MSPRVLLLALLVCFRYSVAQVIQTVTATSYDGARSVIANIEHCGDGRLGVTIRDSFGDDLGSACQDGIEVLPSTSFLNLTGGTLPDLLFVSKVGAKTIATTVLRYQDGSYRQTLALAGWSVELATVKGKRTLTFTQYQHSLTVAYVWKGSAFEQKVIPELPSVSEEVSQSEAIIRNSGPLIPETLISACKTIAVVFVAEGKPEEAIAECSEARSQVLMSSRILSVRQGQTIPTDEREAAAKELDAIIAKISQADQQTIPHVTAEGRKK